MGNKTRFIPIPNSESYEPKKEIHYVRPYIGKFELLRGLYHYLKQIQHNKYVSNRAFHQTDVKITDFTPYFYYTYRFDFEPFKKEANCLLRMELELDMFSGMNVKINMVREGKNNDAFSTNFLTHLLVERGDIKQANYEKFGDLMNNIHFHAVRCACESNAPREALKVIEKFVPEDEMKNNEEIMNLYNSMTGISKYNL